MAACLREGGRAPYPLTDDGSIPRRRHPISIVERPITLPRSTLAIEGSIGGGQEAPLGGAPYGWLGSSLGASFGLTDDITLSAMPLGLLYLPHLSYNRVSVGFEAQSKREIGLSSGVTFNQYDGSSPDAESSRWLTLHAALYLRAYVEHRAKLFFSPALTLRVPLSTSSISPTRPYAGIGLPLAAAIKIIEPVSIKARTSLNIYDLRYVGNSMFIPLGFDMIFSVPGRLGPILDITPSFTFPYLFHPANNGRMINAAGAIVDVRAVQADTFTAGLSVTTYLYL
jgi:hypothetical protein